MSPESAVLMAQYNRWMNRQLYEAAAALPEAEVMRDKGAFFGSLFHTLNHIAAADIIWLQRLVSVSQHQSQVEALQAFPQPNSLRFAVAPQLSELWVLRQDLDSFTMDWAAGLTQAQMALPLAYCNMAGDSHAKNLGALVLHFFNHQTHHRGQATTLLSQAGLDVGVTDLLALIPDLA